MKMPLKLNLKVQPDRSHGELLYACCDWQLRNVMAPIRSKAYQWMRAFCSKKIYKD